MSPQDQIKAFAQSIYLTIKNRYYDDIDGDDGVVYQNQVIDWTNMFLDELENSVGPDGQLVDWWFARQSGYTLGTVTAGNASVSTPTAIDRLIADEQRYVQILQDNAVVANFAVVHPKDISSRTDRITEDMCAIVGTNIVFSRQFRTTEQGGTIIGDVVLKLTRLSTNNAKLLTTVRPKQLLILGVAKNATLPDIVQGGLSPSYATKYDNLLAGAIARSVASSISSQAGRDNYNNVRGIY